jgi:endonuclease/exonuclease/phosphatase family metal-dependent hydrolase
VGERRLRVVSYNVAGMLGGVEAVAAAVRPLRPDVVLVQDGPWRLRWRTPTAQLAAALGLVHAGGGRDSAGNALLVSIRVDVDAVTPIRFPLLPGRLMRGAVVARCRVGDARFAVAGARLADDPAERESQRAALASAVGALTEPLLVAGDLGGGLDGLRDTITPVGGGLHGSILAGRGVRVEGFDLGTAGPSGYHPAAVEVTLGSL